MKLFLITVLFVSTVCAKLNVFVNDKKLDNVNLKKLDPHHNYFYLHNEDSSSKISSRNAIDDKIIAYLEDARGKFGEGFNESGIPPLDPFTIDNVDINIDQKYILNANINLSNVTVVGLQDFVIELVHFRVLGLYFEYEFIVPELVYTSGYSLEGKLAMAVPLHSRGDIKLQANRLHIAGNATLGAKSDGYLLLKTFFVDFDIEETEVNITDLIGIIQLDNVLNWILNQLSDDFFQGQRDRLNEFASKILFDILGDVVGNISLSDIVG